MIFFFFLFKQIKISKGYFISISELAEKKNLEHVPIYLMGHTIHKYNCIIDFEESQA